MQNLLIQGTFHITTSSFNPSNPKSDWHSIYPYSVTAESFIKIMRMKSMITSLRGFHYQT